MASAYILNVDAKVVHKREGLTEQCNTDQIVRRRQGETIPHGYTRCAHCFGATPAPPK